MQSLLDMDYLVLSSPEFEKRCQPSRSWQYAFGYGGDLTLLQTSVSPLQLCAGVIERFAAGHSASVRWSTICFPVHTPMHSTHLTAY